MGRRFAVAALIVAISAGAPCAAQTPAPSGGGPQGGGPQPPTPGGGLGAAPGATSGANATTGLAPAAIQSTTPPISFRLVPGTIGQNSPGMPSGPPLNTPMGAGSVRSVVINPGPCVSPTPSEAGTTVSGAPCGEMP